MGPDLHTTHAKSINAIVGKYENVLNQSAWIGIIWIEVSINSIMLLRTYEPTQSTYKNNSNDSIKLINHLNIHVDLFWKLFDFFLSFFLSISIINILENLGFHWLFGIFFNQLNRLNHTSRSKSIDSSIYEDKLTQTHINSLGKGTESIQSILRK